MRQLCQKNQHAPAKVIAKSIANLGKERNLCRLLVDALKGIQSHLSTRFVQVNQELVQQLETYVETPAQVNLTQVIKDLVAELEKAGVEVETFKTGVLQQIEENGDVDIEAAATAVYDEIMVEIFASTSDECTCCKAWQEQKKI